MTETLEILNTLNAKVVRLVEQGNISQAVVVAKWAIKLGHNRQSTEHPVFADSLNNLAELYRVQSRYIEAESLYTQALNLRKRLFGEEHIDVAQSINNLAALYFILGDYKQAEQDFYKALNLWKRLLGDEHPEVLTGLNNIAEVYREQGRYLDAEKIYLQILEIQNNLPEEQNPDIWRTLNNLASLYESQGRYADSEKKHSEALSKIKHQLGSEHPQVAATLNNLASLYNSQGRHSQAEANYLQALTIWKKTLGDKHYNVAATLNNIAWTYKSQGRFVEAEKIYLEALVIRKDLLGEEHPDIAVSLSNLAEIYLLQGRYSEAEQKYLEVLAMKKKLLTSEHPDMATSLNDLAVLYTYQGRYSQAEKMYLEALRMSEDSLGEEHPESIQVLNNLAKLYQEQGRYSEAEQKYLQVLTIRKNLWKESHPDIADTLNEIGEIYRLQGRYSDSEKMHLEALGIRKSLLGEKHDDVAASLNNLAVLYDLQFKHSQAESLLLEALKISLHIFGNKHPKVATTMNNLAAIYGDMGRYREAEQIHLEVLETRKALLGEEHPSIAVTLNNLAEIYLSLGRYGLAEQKYVEALKIRKSLFGEEHPDVAHSLNNLATLLTAIERPVESLSYRIQASYIYDKMISRVFAFSSESDRLALIEKLRGNFDLFLSLINNYLSESDEAKQQALDFVLKRKALTATSLAAQNEALYSDRYPHLQDKFRQLGELNAQLINLTFSVAQIEDFATYQNKLAELEAQYNNLQKHLASQVPEIQLSEQLPNRFAVAEALPPDSILVEFVRFDVFNFRAVPAKEDAQWYPPRYLAFILPAGLPDAVQMIDLGEAELIDNLIQRLRLQASDSTKQTLGWGKVSAVPKLHIKPYNPTAAIQLSQALVQPIHEAVRGYKNLILAPDGNLNLVPFQILPIDETGICLLIDEHTISYLGVGRDILRSQVQTNRTASAPIIIADPDFDLTNHQTSTEIPRAIASEEFLNTLDSTKLFRASGTRFLGESVAKKLKDAKLFLGTEALETHLTNSQCPQIMLIATHGLFLPDSPQEPPQHQESRWERFSASKLKNPMMRSGLALAGANTWLFGDTLPPAAGKGFVFAQEIANLDLWTNELTVLSACDTARGDIKIGEGVFGLRRAFAVAGSKTLVMSLWKVPDKATAFLIERFFDNLQQGMPRAEALQKAQNYTRKITIKELRQSPLGIEVLKELLRLKELSQHSKIDCQEEDTPLEHPFYWGAWICQGNTEKLEVKS
jgi:tetratricopeptide (TPR) repeat protein